MSTTTAVNAKPKRPIGVTLLAIVFLWIGCGGTLFFPFVARSGGLAYVVQALFGNAASEQWLNAEIWAATTITWLLYVAYAVIGFGLWRLRNWARRGVIVVLTLMPLMGIGVAWSNRGNAWIAAGTLLWCTTPAAWMFWYLMRPGVQFAFGKYSVESGAMPPQLSGVPRVAVAIASIASTAGLLLLCLLFGMENEIRWSGAYQMAVTQAQASPCAIAVMGGSFTPGWFTTGEWSEGTTDGSADFSIPVHGTGAKGTLDISAKKQNGGWVIDSLILSNDKGQVNLTTPAAPCHP